MRDFLYQVVTDPASACHAAGQDAYRKFIAGGTTLVDLMKLDVELPLSLIDINQLPLAEITDLENGGLRIGALARNSTVAYHPLVRERYPVLSSALLSGASAQLRNRATIGGNLLQRTRCTYFRDVYSACNKRTPGAGCAAQDGHHRSHAILGVSDHCFAANPSDMNVALAVLEPTITILQPNSQTRHVAFADFHTLPGRTPHIESVLQQGELITNIELPPLGNNWRGSYLKMRDRESYEFALVSAAVMLKMEGPQIREARVAFGGVATKPWRAPAVEQALVAGLPLREAAARSVQGAMPRRDNAFKAELLPRVVHRVLADLLRGSEG